MFVKRPKFLLTRPAGTHRPRHALSKNLCSGTHQSGTHRHGITFSNGSQQHILKILQILQILLLITLVIKKQPLEEPLEQKKEGYIFVLFYMPS
jgi:hypothetical protein